jgi:excisionase family DNA binding protein
MSAVGSVAVDAASHVLDVHELAKLLKCSERHIYRQVNAGVIPAPAKIGTLNRWSRVIIEKWISDGCPIPPNS